MRSVRRSSTWACHWPRASARSRRRPSQRLAAGAAFGLQRQVEQQRLAALFGVDAAAHGRAGELGVQRAGAHAAHPGACLPGSGRGAPAALGLDAAAAGAHGGLGQRPGRAVEAGARLDLLDRQLAGVPGAGLGVADVGAGLPDRGGTRAACIGAGLDLAAQQRGWAPRATGGPGRRSADRPWRRSRAAAARARCGRRAAPASALPCCLRPASVAPPPRAAHRRRRACLSPSPRPARRCRGPRPAVRARGRRARHRSPSAPGPAASRARCSGRRRCPRPPPRAGARRRCSGSCRPAGWPAARAGRPSAARRCGRAARPRPAARSASAVRAACRRPGRGARSSSCAACTSPSCTLRFRSGASCQPIFASCTSTASVSLCQRSQPMRPPARSEPVTSRLSSVWPAGR